MSKILYTYDNYIFDLYGTLVDILTDEESDAFWRKIAKILKCDSTEVKADYKDLCNQKQEEVGADGEFELLEVFDHLVKKYNSNLTKEELAYKFRKASIVKMRLFPFVKHGLNKLKKHNKGVYLISNAQACFTMKEIEVLGLKKYFDGIVISSEVGFKKPSSKIFEIALEKFGLDKSTCLYAGNDPVDDIQGAEGSDIQAHFVSH